MTSTDWFDEYGNMLRVIPESAVADCTQLGQDASENVEYSVVHRKD
jgi:hypothetical protein